MRLNTRTQAITCKRGTSPGACTTRNLIPHLHVCHFRKAHLTHEFGTLWLSPEVVGAARVVHVTVSARAPGARACPIVRIGSPSATSRSCLQLVSAVSILNFCSIYLPLLNVLVGGQGLCVYRRPHSTALHNATPFGWRCLITLSFSNELG